MPKPRSPKPRGGPAIPLLFAADLQDNLLTATNDLDRLQSLLSHACDELLLGFHGAIERIRTHLDAAAATQPGAQAAEGGSAEVCDSVMQHLSIAVTALQFQDMASQLIAHSHKRLRNCADRIARESMVDEEDGEALAEEAPLRPNPVTQDEMDAGSVELF